MTLTLHHPDCLPRDTDAQDLGILCIANDLARLSLVDGVPGPVVRELAHLASELRDKAGDVRALMQEAGR